MANKIYPKWKEARLQSTANAALDGTGVTGLFVALIDTAVYTYNDAHEYYDTGGSNDVVDGLVGTLVELTSKTFVAGLLDAADSTIPTVTGAQSEALVLLIKNAGAQTTWRLFAYFDTGVTGLPVTPNGGNIDITWNVAGIAQL
jgi:hypothetical protein